MDDVRHLGFLTVRNFTYQSDRESQYASPCQILCQLVELLRRYGRFSISEDGGRPPSWICFTCIGTTHEKHLLVFVTVRNLFRISGFDNMPVVMFSEFGLKNAYLTPFWGRFLGIWPPRWHILSVTLTKGNCTRDSCLLCESLIVQSIKEQKCSINCLWQLLIKLLDKYQLQVNTVTFYRASIYALAVYAIAVCPSVSVRLSVSVRHKSVFY